MLVKPGRYFGPDGEGYVRLVYCRDASLIREATSRIARALTDSPRSRPSRASRAGPVRARR
jgi:aspartate/methionine/tyrosine aminotransferase